jgi:acetyl-CoA carboxylase biotin carboxylase subunit
MFSKVLIANRGEIAVRVAHTLQCMGVRTVTVYSDPDRHALHAICADEAYALEGEAASDTYLRGDRIVALALQHGVEAIHPGYGFLSEDADFAQRCVDAGLIFIGPAPEVIRRLGDKVEAKRIMEAAGVPVVPGWSAAEPDDADLAIRAQDIGYPVLIKAAAGGGGKGMRVVPAEDQLHAAAAAARREAGSAFGDERIFLEKYIEQPRHVEVQILGDAEGRVLHLFERECSIQRRHQKIIEETPSPALSVDQRAALTAAAVRAAEASGYTNAGTVEFLVDQGGEFYFLEVNTRLQVEHPVTEMVTGIDLVRAQVQVAAGESLPFEQADIAPQGHAIECRVYAENPAAGFLPSTGTITHYVAPSGPGVRVDSGVGAGSDVGVHYDPMLAKLTCQAPTRDAAIEKMLWCLKRFVVLGVETNVAFLHEVVTHPAFRSGLLHTHFLDEHSISAQPSDSESALLAAAVACKLGFAGAAHQPTSLEPESQNPWRSAGGWRMCP